MPREPGRAEQAAQRYAETGWPVFPTMPDSDPCRNAQRTGCACKAPVTPHGFKDATTDPGKIAWLWAKDPARNVAIATGAPGPDVLDIDAHGERGNGFDVWNQARRAGLVENPRAIIRTPSGGLHAYFAGTEQGSGAIRDRHVDFKAQGGYVLAPPSAVHGRPYEVVRHQASAAVVNWQDIRALAEPQRERHRQPVATTSTEPDNLVRYVAECTDHVNDRLFWAACRMAEAGRHDRLPELIQAAYDAGEDRRGQAERTVESALRTAHPGAARPLARQPEHEAG
jgi:hypothetical protein